MGLLGRALLQLFFRHRDCIIEKLRVMFILHDVVVVEPLTPILLREIFQGLDGQALVHVVRWIFARTRVRFLQV